MEKIINVKVSGSEIEQSSNYGGIQGEGGARTLKISFDDEWTELSKSVTFFDVNMKNPVKVMLTTLNKNTDESYNVPIPKEPLKEGERFTYIIDGSTDGALQRSVKKELKVKYAPVSGSAAVPEDITPSLADQLNLSIQHESKRTDALEEKMTAAEEDILKNTDDIKSLEERTLVSEKDIENLENAVSENKEENDAWHESLLDFYLPFLFEGYAASEEQAKEGINNESFLTPKTGKAQIEHILTNEGFPVIKENVLKNAEDIRNLEEEITAVKESTEEEENKSFMYYGDRSIKPSDSSFFEFITDDETMTASIMILSVDLEVRDIVIPYEYVVGDKVYKVTSIAANGFSDYYMLESIVIPNSVIEIGNAAFSGCYELRRVNFPSNITTIPKGAFEDCINLFDVTISEGVEKISLKAFSNSGIKSITIPESVLVIDESAFENTNLTDVHFKGTKEQWDAITIKTGNDLLLNATIHYDWVEDTYTRKEVDEKLTPISQTLTIVEADVNYHAGEIIRIETSLDEKINVGLSDMDYNKADKPIIETCPEYYAVFYFLENYNKEIRYTQQTDISFQFQDGEYPEDYTSALSFYSGATPTAIDYTGSGILNWVGTDCTNENGLSIFQPSANTHYDIVFYYNGNQFIGLVNGYVPATGNVVSA